MTDPTLVRGRRVAAFIIDGIIAAAINFAIFFAMAEKDTDIAQQLLEGEVKATDTAYGNIDLGDTEYSIVGGDFFIYLAITLAIGIVYHWVIPGLRGWTPGKLMLGIRIVGENGRFAGIGRNAVREILWIVDAFPYIIPYLTGFVTMMVTERHQRVGDLVAKTFVIKQEAVGTPVPAAGSLAAAGPPPVAPPTGAAPPPPPPPAPGSPPPPAPPAPPA